MKIVDRDTIEAVLTKDSVIEAVRGGFIDHSEGRVQSPSPMHMSYMNDAGERIGDCHVKAAHSDKHSVIAIKVAIGFYENPQRDLPVNNGLVVLLSRETGEPVALLQDEGVLTTYRTAAAGAIAASLAHTQPDDVIGIVGTGDQAYHQAAWVAHHLGLNDIMVYGRSSLKADALCNRLSSTGLAARRAENVAELCAACRVVITTTPAQSPVVLASDLPAGAQSRIHFVAMGADTYGKQELDTEIIALAKKVVVDDAEQCLDHGDVAAASRAGVLDVDRLLSLGSALSTKTSIVEGVSVVDLTGLGAQDMAIASLVV